MAFLPARMSRLLVGGHKQHLDAVIETLHSQGVLHIEDYKDPTGTTRIGTPLERGDAVSDLLVRVRGLQKALGSEAVAAKGRGLDAPSLVPQAEAATQPALDAVSQVRNEIVQADAESAALRPFAGLDLDLSAATGLASVKVYLGTLRADPTPALNAAGIAHEVQVSHSSSGLAVAVVVAVKDAAAADKALASVGYTAAVLPHGRSGTPAARLAQLAAARDALGAKLAQAEGRVEALRAEWGAKLAALERQLTADVEKTQAPLRFAVTASTFHVEGWVPRSQASKVKSALTSRFGDKVYLHDLGDLPEGAMAHGGGAGHGHDAPANGHGASASHGAHGDGHAAAGDAHEDDGHHGHDAKDEPPIHLENPKVARPYQFLLGLLGKPRYGEVDPTKLMLIFFPLFFGLMVGDLAVGLIIALVGLFLQKNKVFGIGGPAVGKVLVMGGLSAALVGGIVFGEALGIHFVTPEPHEEGEEKELSWEEILGVTIPSEGFLHKTGGEAHADAAAHDPLADAAHDETVATEGATGTDPALAVHAETAEEEKGILAPHTDEHLSVNGWFNLGYYSKTHDTLALLIWAMIIGFVHIVLGLLIGVRNVYKAHGATLAIQEKAAWLTLIAGGIAAILAWGTLVGYVGLGIAAASVVLLYMGAQHVLGVGFIALLEIPGLAGNILSYTRLAAIGASKAGMAIAFADIGFNVIGGGNVHSVAGWLVYLVGFVLIIVLSIIAGSLQSLRLQFVEFFGKFYTGGGRAYLPFGRRAQ